MAHATEKRPVGRPSEYRPEFAEAARNKMAEGFSKTATAGSLGVCKATFDNWCREFPEFLGAVKDGEAMRTLFLETDLLAAKDGPTVTSRIFALKNAAPDEWRDRHMLEHSGPNNGPLRFIVGEMTAQEAAEAYAASLAAGRDQG